MGQLPHVIYKKDKNQTEYVLQVRNIQYKVRVDKSHVFVIMLGEYKMKDFFISYTSVDEKKATWIAEVLENEGYTTIIQAWDFEPGSNFVVEMQNALITSNRVIAVLSEAYCASVFTNPEWASAFANDPMGQERKLIPIRVEKFTPQGLLKTIVYIDLAELLDAARPDLENKAKEKLLTNITGEKIRKSDMFLSN